VSVESEAGEERPTSEVTIRLARDGDRARLWQILEPIIREGETYAWPRDLEREAALQMWSAGDAEVFVAELADAVVGTAYLKTNHLGGGDHVANCGYATAGEAEGNGVARALCAHTIERASQRGFRAIQFNFVVSTNLRAVATWERFGFERVGVLPGAFRHPSKGEVDVYVMYRRLEG